MESRDPQVSDNYLLAALPATEYTALVAHCQIREFATRQALHDVDIAFEAVYFPLGGLASVTTLMADGAMIEVGTIGREGLVGLTAFFGAATNPLQTFVQVPGYFVRVPIDAFRAASAPGTELHRLLLRYAQAYYVLAAQSAGCNRLHPNEERCARWILLTQDRVGHDTFPLTHEFLGYMLGVRRPSVTLALQTLHMAGLLTYQRGIITVTDRAGLEAAACECYAIIRRAFDFFPGPA